MKRPGEADIEAAKEYVRQRIECEQAMTTLLESVMKEAAEKIVDICYSAGVNPQSFRYSDLPVRVQFDLDLDFEAREWNGRYFLQASCWRATLRQQQQPQAPQPTPQPAPQGWQSVYPQPQQYAPQPTPPAPVTDNDPLPF